MDFLVPHNISTKPNGPESIDNTSADLGQGLLFIVFKRTVVLNYKNTI